MKAGGQRRRIVGDHEVGRPQEIDKARTRRMRDASAGVDDEQLGVSSVGLVARRRS
jgi:hypothetical protein